MQLSSFCSLLPDHGNATADPCGALLGPWPLDKRKQFKFKKIVTFTTRCDYAPTTSRNDSGVNSGLSSWNRKLSRHFRAGEYARTLDLFHEMQLKGVNLNSYSFVPIINACGTLRALEEGRRIHALVTETGCESNVYVGSCLIDMYVKCGSTEDALGVFNNMPIRDVFSWTAMIRGCVKFGEGQKALELCQEMQHTGVDPDPFTFVAVLNACASVAALEEGRHYHKQIIQRGYDSNVFLANSLIHMYAKCGSMEDAWSVFKDMPRPTPASWNAIIMGYSKCGQAEKALELFRQMDRESIDPDPDTFMGLLNACAALRALEEGRRVHEQIIQRGCETEISVANGLVYMYANCGSMEDAWKVCNKMPTRDVGVCKAMILGYVNCGQGQKALELFWQMQEWGFKPDPATFVGVLHACTNIGALEEGRRIHEQIIQSGCESNRFVGNSLMDMYAKCGSMQDAWRVFNKMPTRDVVSWTVMIAGNVKCGLGYEALELFLQMQSEGVDADTFAFVAAVNACASLGSLKEGQCIHEQIIKRGCESDVFVGSSLVDMYVKCGSILDARRVFDNIPIRNVVSWNSIIQGYVKCGEAQKALELFREMQQEGVDPDPLTFVDVLSACARLGAIEQGRRIHKQIREQDCEFDVFLGSSLIHMYTKCGSIDEAMEVFKKMPARNVVTWTTMILGYAKCGEGLKALELFEEMKQEGLDPDSVTFVAVLNACASVGALEDGQRFHDQVIQRGYESNIFLGNSLVHMYAKCGSIEDALRVFNKMPTHDVISWNAIILGHVKCGEGYKSLELFQEMQQEGVDPDPFTFVAILNACARARLLEEGRCFHEQIIQKGCEFNVFVGGSLVHMYAKCGSLEDARTVFNKMPTRNLVSWNAMIQAYVKFGEVHMVLELFKEMQQEGIDPDPITFVLVLNACASSRALEEGRLVHQQIIERGYESNSFVGAGLAEMYAKCGFSWGSVSEV